MAAATKEIDYEGTPYIPIYVMLPLNVVNRDAVTDPAGLKNDLRSLRDGTVDGVMVDCWWGLVEKTPLHYNWKPYRELFRIVHESGLKLQVVMSFHQCGGNVGDDVYIPLPSWILEVGRMNPDIFYTDQHGNRNPEYLSCGVDKERLFHGRTPLEIYYDFMKNFRQEFQDFFEDGTLAEIEIGLGPAGEMRFPSYPESFGWKYPGIGEFQSYDKYLNKNLQAAAQTRGHLTWGHSPSNPGEYNDRSRNTEFFKDGGEYLSYYGQFFLSWYSKTLLDHADRVLALASLAFDGTPIATKVSGIHWLYKTASHGAEVTAGYNNSSNLNGYEPIVAVLKRHGSALNFTCVEMRSELQNAGSPEALSDPEVLVWQVLNAAWNAGIRAAGENALNVYDRDSYNQILRNAKPAKDAEEGQHLAALTYLRLSPVLMEPINFVEFKRFVARLHGGRNQRREFLWS